MQYNEIYNICQPVIDWLKEHYPHGHKIVISTNGAEMIECGKLVALDKDLKSITFEKPFMPKDYEKEIQEILNTDTSNIQDDTYRAQIEALQIFFNHGKQSGFETKKNEDAK